MRKKLYQDVDTPACSNKFDSITHVVCCVKLLFVWVYYNGIFWLLTTIFNLRMCMSFLPFLMRWLMTVVVDFFLSGGHDQMVGFWGRNNTGEKQEEEEEEEDSILVGARRLRH